MQTVDVALVDGVGAESAALFVGERTGIRASEQDGVGRLTDLREVAHFAVVFVVGGIDQCRSQQARVIECVPVATLLADAVAGIRNRAFDASADIGRVVEEGHAQGVVACRCDRPSEVALLLIVIHGTEQLERIERRHIIFAVQVSIAAKYPGLIAKQRPARRKGGVVGREILRGRILVVRLQACVLEEVVHGPGEKVAAGLRDDVRQESGNTDVLRGDTPCNDLLLLDNLGIEVCTEGAGLWIGHVDPVDVVRVVGRDTHVTADVAVVDSGLRCRIARQGRIVRQHARDDLQVALIRTPGRQGLGQLERDVGRRGGASRVNNGRLRNHVHRLSQSTHGEHDPKRHDLSGSDEDILESLRDETLQRGGDGVLR